MSFLKGKDIWSDEMSDSGFNLGRVGGGSGVRGMMMGRCKDRVEEEGDGTEGLWWGGVCAVVVAERFVKMRLRKDHEAEKACPVVVLRQKGGGEVWLQDDDSFRFRDWWEVQIKKQPRWRRRRQIRVKNVENNEFEAAINLVLMNDHANAMALYYIV